jgi:hypothetical protein
MIGPQHLIFDTYVSAIAYNSPDRRSMLAMRHFISHVHRRREVWPQMTTDMPPKTGTGRHWELRTHPGEGKKLCTASMGK